MRDVLKEAGVPVNRSMMNYVLEDVFNFRFTGDVEENAYEGLRQLPADFLPVLKKVTGKGFLKELFVVLMAEQLLRDRKRGSLEVNAATVKGLLQLACWRRSRLPRECQWEFGDIVATLSRTELLAKAMKKEEDILRLLLSSLARLR